MGRLPYAKALVARANRAQMVSDPEGLTPGFLTHPRATYSTVILGLVPRTQPSAREKRGDRSITGQLDVI